MIKCPHCDYESPMQSGMSHHCPSQDPIYPASVNTLSPQTSPPTCHKCGGYFFAEFTALQPGQKWCQCNINSAMNMPNSADKKIVKIVTHFADGSTETLTK